MISQELSREKYRTTKSDLRLRTGKKNIFFKGPEVFNSSQSSNANTEKQSDCSNSKHSDLCNSTNDAAANVKSTELNKHNNLLFLH